MYFLLFFDIIFMCIFKFHIYILSFPRWQWTNYRFWFISNLFNILILFPYLLRYYHIMFIIIVFWLGSNWPLGAFFVSALLLLMLTSFFLPSSVSLSFFIIAVPMRECVRKRSCVSSTFPVAILNGTWFFGRRNSPCFGRSLACHWLIKLN